MKEQSIERTKNIKKCVFDVKNREIPDNFKIFLKFYKLILVSYLLLYSYRKYFFLKCNFRLCLQYLSHHPSQKCSYCFIPALWLCYLHPLSFNYYTSYENSSIEQVQIFSLSQWVKCGDVYNSSLQRKTWRGCSHEPVIMESTLLSVYYRPSDPNKCILSSHIYLGLL